MSFSSGVKEDLARIMSSKACCRRAEFAAFFLSCGNIHIGAKHSVSLSMDATLAVVSRKMFTLARDFGLKREIVMHRNSRLQKNQVFSLLIPAQPAVGGLLRELGMLDEDDTWQLSFPRRLRQDFLAGECCRRAYLRGAFLAAGSLTDPGGSYHLEFAAHEPAQAELIKELLAGFDISAKITRRKEQPLVYLKGAEQISLLLTVLGSHRALLEFENTRIEKEVRNRVNRQVNCDNANMDKAIASGMRQADDIRYIAAQLGLEKLPRTLREAASWRLESPEASLSELAETTGLGRSALNHRLRRLGEIADNIRSFGVRNWNIR
ncbi:MAG: DNA-binding protein WhiA [Bacillota bacterium]|nr:DNA-binding protein WhiA [Bacillota bacterium]